MRDDLDQDDEIAKAADDELLAELVKEIVEAIVEAKAEEITAAVGAKIAALPKPNALDEANLQGQIRGFLRSAMSEELGAALTTVEQRIGDIAEKLQADIDQTDQTAAALGQNAVAAMNSTKAEMAQLTARVDAGNRVSEAAGEAAQGAVDTAGNATQMVEGFLADQRPPKGAHQVKAFSGDWGKRGWPQGTQVVYNGAVWLSTANTKPTDEPGPASKVWLQCGLMFAGFVGAGSGRAARALANVPPFFTQDTTPPAGPGNAVPFGGLPTQHIKGWINTATMQSFVAMQSVNPDGSPGDWVWSQSGG